MTALLRCHPRPWETVPEPAHVRRSADDAYYSRPVTPIVPAPCQAVGGCFPAGDCIYGCAP